MEISRESLDRLRITERGERLLGIATGVAAAGFGAQRVTAVTNRAGMLVGSNSAETWPITRIVSYEGYLYLAGPYRDGQTLRELLATTDGTRSTTQACATLTSHLSVLMEPQHDTTGAPLRMCSPITTFIDSEGRILLLSDELCAAINRYMDGAVRDAVLRPYIREVRSGIDAQRVTLAALLYHALVGDQPSDTPQPIWTHRPEVPRLLADWVDASLTARPSDGLPPVTTELTSILAAGAVTEDIDTETATRRRATAEESAARRTRQVTRRTFWRTRGPVLALAVGIAVAVLAIPTRIVWIALQPPATAEMSPELVIETFYDAWTVLDHMLMEETIAGRRNREAAVTAARDRIREVTNVFVIDRVRTAQLMETPLMPAPEWLAAGAPEDRSPYGVVDRSVTVLRRDTEELVARVTYTMLRPAVDEQSGDPQTTAVRLEDTVTVRRGRRAWEITEMVPRVLDDDPAIRQED